MAYLDCGISTVTPQNSYCFRIVFAPFGGTALPLETDALNKTKWSFYTEGGMPEDPLLTILAIVKIDDATYDVYMNHKVEPVGIGITFDSSAMASNQGGYCDSPEYGDTRSIADPLVRYPDENMIEMGPVSLLGEPLYKSTTIIRRKGGRKRMKR